MLLLFLLLSTTPLLLILFARFSIQDDDDDEEEDDDDDDEEEDDDDDDDEVESNLRLKAKLFRKLPTPDSNFLPQERSPRQIVDSIFSFPTKLLMSAMVVGVVRATRATAEYDLEKLTLSSKNRRATKSLLFLATSCRQRVVGASVVSAVGVVRRWRQGSLMKVVTFVTSGGGSWVTKSAEVKRKRSVKKYNICRSLEGGAMFWSANIKININNIYKYYFIIINNIYKYHFNDHFIIINL